MTGRESFIADTDAANISHNDGCSLSPSRQLLISILKSLFLARLLYITGYYPVLIGKRLIKQDLLGNGKGSDKKTSLT